MSTSFHNNKANILNISDFFSDEHNIPHFYQLNKLIGANSFIPLAIQNAYPNDDNIDKISKSIIESLNLDNETAMMKFDDLDYLKIPNSFDGISKFDEGNLDSYLETQCSTSLRYLLIRHFLSDMYFYGRTERDLNIISKHNSTNYPYDRRVIYDYKYDKPIASKEYDLTKVLRFLSLLKRGSGYRLSMNYAIEIEVSYLNITSIDDFVPAQETTTMRTGEIFMHILMEESSLRKYATEIYMKNIDTGIIDQYLDASEASKMFDGDMKEFIKLARFNAIDKFTVTSNLLTCFNNIIPLKMRKEYNPMTEK